MLLQQAPAPRGQRALGESDKARCRGIRLQAAVAAAAAALAALPDDHVAHLARDAVAAGVQLAADDDAAADARAQRDHHHVLCALRRARSDLAERRAVGVVIQLHRAAKVRPERIRKADVVHAQIGAEFERAGRFVKRAGHADADARDLLRRSALRRAQAERQLLHGRAQPGRVARRRGCALLVQQRAVRRAERGFDCRAAQIDTDPHT